MSVNRFEPLGLGVGTLLNNRYDVVNKLGSGGMSAVYQVVDRALNNDMIALKLFDPKLMDDPTQLARFRHEVQITRKLTHPNIVRTYDFGEAQGRYYFMTMEHIRGVTLEKLIQSQYKGGLSFEECLKILIEVLKGISYAHSMGVIHRDLKPANILISDTGEVKISDFGLARTSSADKRFTQTGECVGTPYYMAPEQIKEEPTDERSDLYAIGIVAFELVAGCVPFSDESWFNLASKIIKDPLPELPRKKHVPPWFQEFICKATSKSKEDRFVSADEMQKLLENELSSTLDDTQVQSPLSEGKTEPLPVSPRYSERSYEDTVALGVNFTSWYRYAPIILIASLVALAGIAVVNVGTKSIDNVTKDFKQNTTVLTEFTDTLGKLQQVVVDIHKNKDEINQFLEAKEKQQADSNTPAAANTPKHE